MENFIFCALLLAVMVSVFANHILNEYATKLNVRKNFVLSICSVPTDFLLEKKIKKKERRHVSHIIIGNLLFFLLKNFPPDNSSNRTDFFSSQALVNASKM